MDAFTACEQAYKNDGYDNGQRNTEIAMRVVVAYEQLAKCHTDLCKAYKRGENDELIYSIQDAMNSLLDIQVKLGILKREEDL
jgi:hypothetical protein